MTRLALIAVAGQVTGLAIGATVCHAAWAHSTGETYKIGAKL